MNDNESINLLIGNKSIYNLNNSFLNKLIFFKYVFMSFKICIFSIYFFLNSSTFSNLYIDIMYGYIINEGIYIYIYTVKNNIHTTNIYRKRYKYVSYIHRFISLVLSILGIYFLFIYKLYNDNMVYITIFFMNIVYYIFYLFFFILFCLKILKFDNLNKVQISVIEDTLDIQPFVSKNYYCDILCCICLENFKEEENIRTLKCFHYFHINCIAMWLEKNNTCPLCRIII